MFIFKLIKNHLKSKFLAFTLGLKCKRFKGEFKIGDYFLYIDGYLTIPKNIYEKNQQIKISTYKFVQNIFDYESKSWSFGQLISSIYSCLNSNDVNEIDKEHLKSYILLCVTSINNDIWLELNKMSIATKSDKRDHKISQILNF